MIEVGTYIRTNEGHIGKVIRNYISNDYTPDEWVVQIDKNANIIITESMTELKIIDSKENIANLLKVGDFVNGEIISNITNENDYLSIYTYNKKYTKYNINEIKTILTKEQYNNNCYRVEG